jgi:ABC-type amino acid transport substrate-binding protein
MATERRRVMILASLVVALSTVGAGGVRRMAEAEPIRVLTFDVPPFSIQAPGSGGQRGVYVEIMEALLERLGIEATIEFVGNADGQRLAREARNVVFFPLARNAEREAKYRWIGIALEQELGFVTLAARGPIESLEGGREVGRLGAIEGSSALRYLEARGFDNIVSGSASQLVSMLADGRIDAYFGGFLILRHVAGMRGIAADFAFGHAPVVGQPWSPPASTRPPPTCRAGRRRSPRCARPAPSTASPSAISGDEPPRRPGPPRRRGSGDAVSDLARRPPGPSQAPAGPPTQASSCRGRRASPARGCARCARDLDRRIAVSVWEAERREYWQWKAWGTRPAGPEGSPDEGAAMTCLDFREWSTRLLSEQPTLEGLAAASDHARRCEGCGPALEHRVRIGRWDAERRVSSADRRARNGHPTVLAAGANAPVAIVVAWFSDRPGRMRGSWVTYRGCAYVVRAWKEYRAVSWPSAGRVVSVVGRFGYRELLERAASIRTGLAAPRRRLVGAARAARGTAKSAPRRARWGRRDRTAGSAARGRRRPGPAPSASPDARTTSRCWPTSR